MGLLKLLTEPSNFIFYNGGVGGSGYYGDGTKPAMKSLKFDSDSSNQPYIQKDINNQDPKSSAYYLDYIIRGGILAPLSAADDVVRLTKYFTDIKNPSGIVFIAKQNLLSRTGTKTEASKGSLNEGIYTPLSTLAQAGVGFVGAHVNKQGLNFITGPVTYQEAIQQNQFIGTTFLPKNNRLLALTYAITNNQGVPNFSSIKDYALNINESTLISYGGGSNSVLGVGKTNIRFATDNSGNALKSLLNPSSDVFTTSASNFKTWGYKQIEDQTTNPDGLIREDFRQLLTPDARYQKSFLSKSPNYVTKNIEDNLGLSNPGSRLRNRSNYDSGSAYNSPSTALDKVNASYIYKSKSSKYGSSEYTDLNDIIPFSIAILNNELQVGGPYKKYMHFRAFIDNLSDSYNADWNSINYMGRAEKFYKYKGFDRKISMAFTVAAQSKQEITAMYDKLNFLASSLAPEYLDNSSSGYMAGNIAYITVGGYIDDQPGIITSLDYTIPEESTWEIGIDVEGNKADLKNVRQLPHIMRVSLNFIPIHKFRPEKQSFQEDKPGTESKRLLKPGNQKYIDQLRPPTSNYDEEGTLLSITSNQNNDLLVT
jgi:hypothetical protein